MYYTLLAVRNEQEIEGRFSRNFRISFCDEITRNVERQIQPTKQK